MHAGAIPRCHCDAESHPRQQSQNASGYYYKRSGQFENEVRAKKRLQIVMPVAIAVIYILFFCILVFLSKRPHVVLLAVPFALNRRALLALASWVQLSRFAVWVGFIALFGNRSATDCRLW